MPTAHEIDATIHNNLSKLSKTGVLTVRPGYEIANHRLTGKPAIVATVHTKRTVSRDQALPDAIGGLPVDVREATPHQRLRAHDPGAAALTQAYGRPENREPEWPYERDVPSGKRLDSPASPTQTALADHAKRDTVVHRALMALSPRAKATKENLPYAPPAGATLDPIETTTTITAHVSPDAGLATLEKFIGATKQSLVVGMYDFTSGSILNAFESDLGGSKTLQMVLDNPAPNATRDQTDTQTVEALRQNLGTRAKIARALVRSDTLASAWIFPYAYHIKVIVRDGSAFWLSSGNLNNSNQPNFDKPPHTEDRDWHVIIEDPGLAKTFAAYLTQDFTMAEAHQVAAASTEDSRAVSDANAKLAAEANPPPAGTASPPTRGVAPKVFRDVKLKITPLLTPDKLPDKTPQYLSHIVALIENAKTSLYIQLQYIEASTDDSKDEDKDYTKLLQAVAGRVAAGVDVRLIESQQYGEKWAEKMKAAGVDLTAQIRLQPDVHNKGFVVDSSIVVVSSQNFSPAGIENNRDAGVILENPEIAKYFEAVFLSDWDSKAKPFGAPTKKTAAKGAKKSAAKKTAAKKTAAKKSAKKTAAKKSAPKRGK
jgi:hypothetical protein